VDKINGTATIQIAPYETNPTAVISNNLINTSEQQGSYLSNDIPSYWGAGGVTAAKNFTEVKDKDNYFHIIDYTESESEARLKEILKFFIEAKNKLESESLGFSLDEGKKLPVEVYITNNLINSGVNVPAEAVRPDTTPWHAYWMAYYSYINMKPGYSDAEYQVITGHELFHIVQYVYGAYSFLDEEYGGYQYGWLNDGSSTWFEAKLSPLGKNYFSGKARTNSNFIYSPLEIDDGDKGYGASSFLTYLTDQSGYGDKLIYTIYEKIKNGEDNDTGTGALQAALGSSDTLSALFSEFAFKFISKTTGYANWPEPSPPPGGEFTIYPDAPPHISTLNPSALSAWNVKVNLPSGTIPSETYKLVVSLEGGNTFIDGAVYTRDTASSNWQSACEITPDGTCEIAQFYGNGKRLSANIILVNHQAEHPYDQDVPLTLTIEIKEVIKSIMGTWDVTKYDYLCQGFWSQTGELHIFDNGTYTMDLEESERGIADFAGTWELKQEPHITDNPRAYFYSNDVLQFIGTVNETYNEISCDPCIMPASIIVCMRANKILDTP